MAAVESNVQQLPPDLMKVRRDRIKRLISLFGLVDPALLPQQIAQVVIRLGVAGPQCDRSLVACDGLVDALERHQCNAAVVVDIGELGRALECGIIGLHGSR